MRRMKNTGAGQRDAKMSRLGRWVNSFLDESKGREASLSALCAELWPQIVGQWYARKTRVIRLRKSELGVWCESPAVAQQLQHDQEKVITRLNERLEGRFVTSLRPASAGPDRRPADIDMDDCDEQAPGDAVLAAIVLSAEEQERCRKQAETVPQGPLRDRFLQTLLFQAKLTQWKRENGYVQCVYCGALHPPDDRACRECLLALREHRR